MPVLIVLYTLSTDINIQAHMAFSDYFTIEADEDLPAFNASEWIGTNRTYRNVPEEGLERSAGKLKCHTPFTVSFRRNHCQSKHFLRHIYQSFPMP